MNNSARTVFWISRFLPEAALGECSLGAHRLKETLFPKKDTKSASAKGEVVNGEVKMRITLEAVAALGNVFRNYFVKYKAGNILSLLII